MATAILQGAADAGVINFARVVVADPNADRRAAFQHAEPTAAAALDRAAELDSADCRVMLAVKPQMLPAVTREIADRFVAGHPSRLVISILAGTTADGIRTTLGPAARVVRVMPNTPSQVRRGMSAIAAHESAAPDDLCYTRQLFTAVGQTVELPEDLIDAFTGVAGSGPAYVFLLAEALTEAGIAVGLNPDDAATVARATITGAGALLDADDRSADELRRAVTSKNGTTAAALNAFESGDLRGLVKRAVTAARDRGRELGAG